jgi:RNA polymerase sigma-70 factor, ECF subfamily
MPLNEKEILDNQEIIQAILKGDSRGYEILFDRYGAMLFGVIIRIVKNEADAENLLQDCFVKLWRKIDTFDIEKGQFATWIINIARNCAIDFIRSKYYIQRSKNQNIDPIVNPLNDIVSSPISTDTIDMRSIVEKLTPQYRQIIELMYFEGFTQLEISKTYNIPIGTVKTRARLAIHELRQHFDLA